MKSWCHVTAALYDEHKHYYLTLTVYNEQRHCLMPKALYNEWKALLRDIGTMWGASGPCSDRDTMQRTEAL